jgi:polar amino acid transport system substrate-binding protein
MKTKLTALLIGACIGTTAIGAELLVGTDAGFAPFEFKDEKTNEIVGFDMDLIKAIAAVNGDTVKIQNMQFAGLIPAIQGNMIDVAAAGMTITPARQKQVHFTDSYYEVGLVLAVMNKDADKYKTLTDLENKTICAQIGTTGSMLASKVKGAKVTNYDQIGEAFMDMKMGGCQAVLNDKTVTTYYLSKKGDGSMTVMPHLYEPSQNGFAVSKRNPELLKKLNHGLKVIKENGTYDKIYNKWFAEKK